jgi:hypothetical protein
MVVDLLLNHVEEAMDQKSSIQTRDLDQVIVLVVIEAVVDDLEVEHLVLQDLLMHLDQEIVQMEKEVQALKDSKGISVHSTDLEVTTLVVDQIILVKEDSNRDQMVKQVQLETPHLQQVL